MVKSKKQFHIKSLLELNKHNLRETWKIINKLLGKRKQEQTYSMTINGIEVTDNAIIAICNPF